MWVWVPAALLPTGTGVQTLTPVKTPTHNIRMVGPGVQQCLGSIVPEAGEASRALPAREILADERQDRHKQSVDFYFQAALEQAHSAGHAAHQKTGEKRLLPKGVIVVAHTRSGARKLKQSVEQLREVEALAATVDPPHLPFLPLVLSPHRREEAKQTHSHHVRRTCACFCHSLSQDHEAVMFVSEGEKISVTEMQHERHT